MHQYLYLPPKMLFMSQQYRFGLHRDPHSCCYPQPTISISATAIFDITLFSSNPLIVVLLFDFQPKDPENIFAAFAVISQKKLPGVILKREITRIPRTRCWFVGFSKGNSLEIANRFNQNWSTDLVVGTNDCRHYTNGLVECLTGEENVLESLKN